MKYILIVISLLLCGCSHIRFLSNNPDIACKFCNETRHDTVYSTDTILIGAPELIGSDTVWVTPEPEEFSFFISEDSITGDITNVSPKGSTTTVSRRDGKLYVTTRCKEDSLRQVLLTYRQTIQMLESKNKVTTIKKPPVVIKEVPGWFWLLFGFSVACALWIGGWIRKRSKE